MQNRMRHLPDQSSACLGCACQNPDNAAARDLLDAAASLTVTGVIAAIFVTESAEHDRVLELARRAIADQRASCDAIGPFKPETCTRYLALSA